MTRTTGKEAASRAGWLMVAVAVSLGAASALHLSGHIHGRGAPFDAEHAGIAEAILAVVLAGGGGALLTGARGGRRIAMVAAAVAIVGFLNGLNMTARGGKGPDIAYHLGVLPLLLLGLVLLWRAPDGHADLEASTPTH